MAKLHLADFRPEMRAAAPETVHGAPEPKVSIRQTSHTARRDE